ncbi:MAG: protein sorting protein [Rhodospirillales bacterium]|nr:protein sorting protein [Rhodospirillales bacterium]
MITNKLKGAFVAVAAIVAGAMATPASAVPLGGSFAIFGGVQDGQNLMTTNSIDFTGPFVVSSVPGPQGDFAGLTTGTIKDLTFSPFGSVQDFLTFAGSTLNFDLLSITSVTRASAAAGDSLIISGTGRFQETGFDDTNGVIVLTLQDFAGTHISLSFSASAITGEGGGGPNVPEPASAAILGAALLGLGLMRRAHRA